MPARYNVPVSADKPRNQFRPAQTEQCHANCNGFHSEKEARARCRSRMQNAKNHEPGIPEVEAFRFSSSSGSLRLCAAALAGRIVPSLSLSWALVWLCESPRATCAAGKVDFLGSWFAHCCHPFILARGCATNDSKRFARGQSIRSPSCSSGTALIKIAQNGHSALAAWTTDLDKASAPDKCGRPNHLTILIYSVPARQ